MGCLKLIYYQPEPQLKVVKGKPEPQPKLAQSWLSVDPLADERSWVSPYSYVQNSPVMRVDPSGALDTDTKYVDKEGNTILETNDGSDAVIEIDDTRGEKYNQFIQNAKQADDIHSKEWNYEQKSLLTGVEWGDDVENVLMAQHSEEAMIAVQRFWRGDGSFSGYLKNEISAQYQDPEISAQALVMIATLGLIKMPANGSKLKYPGNNPNKAPKGYKWRGKPNSKPGSKSGNYYNSKTRETLRPDLNHSEPIGPHWDYRDPTGKWFRIHPNGTVKPK